MNRRSFIGSAIGSLFGSQIPFVAEEASPGKQLDNSDMADFFTCPHEELLACRMYAIEESGDKFWSPKIYHVDRSETLIRWDAVPIVPTVLMVFVAAGIVEKHGRLIKEARLPISMPLVPRQTFRFCYSMEKPR